MLKTYTSESDVVRAACDIIAPMSLSDVQREVADRASPLFYMSRMLRRYTSAERYAARYTDLVGVGVISFAQGRLVEFQRRVALIGKHEQFKRGARDAWASHPANYGCHVGMRSTLEQYRAEYRDGYSFAQRCGASRDF